MRHTIVYTLISLVPLLMASGAENETVTTVTSLKALQQTVAKAKPGSVVVLKNGTYKESVTLKGKGTQEQPIVIQAESIKGVRLRAPVTLNGHYLSLNGFDCTAVNVKGSKGCRVTRCNFNDSGKAQWLTVDVKSRQIEVDHCLFENKTNNRRLERGCQLIQFKLSNTNESHHIHHNHFRDIAKGKTGNGFETIQLITNGNAKDPKGGDTGNVIEYNLFERCDGESEIISVKSNGNMLRNNTFRNCKGELVLRHGHRNVVNGNWFIGGRGGVRLQGTDQVVVNNVFDGLDRGLMMMDGTITDNLYIRVERALVAHNTFVDCKRTFHIGLNHSKHPEGTVPRACTIANNALYQGKDAEGQLISFVKDQEPEEWTWQNNLYHGTLGISKRQGLRESSAFQMSGEPKLLLPRAKTPSAGRNDLKWPEGHGKEKAGTVVTLLDVDLAGVPRPELGAAGAFQFTGKPVTARPLTQNDVGPLAGLNAKK